MNTFLALLSAATAALTTPPLTSEPAPKADQPAAQPQAAERICRRVALDISSRKKEEVCLTAKEWRDFNNAR